MNLNGAVLIDQTGSRRIDPSQYELVTVLESGVLLLQDKVKKPNMTEMGSTGMTKYGSLSRSEYNSALLGSLGRTQYEKMRKSDGQIRAILRLVKTPVLAARWYIAPADDKRKNQKIADFVENCLMKEMTTSFPQLLTEILTMLDFGFSAFEKVWKLGPVSGQTGQKLIWQKLAQRHALDVTRWDYDDHGGPSGLVLQDPNSRAQGELVIPIDKLLAFTFEREGGDMEGVSVLRPAYKHWYYKDQLYKVDAIQKERHGIGIPVIKLPMGFTDQDKALADDMGRNLRTNEKAHIVLPPNWEIMMLKMEGQPVDALKSIEYHDTLIAREILGQFINATSGTSSQEQLQTLFLKSTRYIAETIRDVFNKYAIPELVMLNFPGVEDFPELRVRRIGDTMDWRTVSFAIRNFIGSGVIIPDDRMEVWIRDEMDLPPVEEDTKRIIVAPLNQGQIPDGTPDGFPGPGDATTGTARQNGGAGATVQSNKPTIQNPAPAGGVAAAGNAPARLPRQSTAKNVTKGPGNNGRVGRDGSGG
jgi:hypothetical protein